MEQEKIVDLQAAAVKDVDTYLRPMLDKERAEGRRAQFTLANVNGVFKVDGSDGFDGTTIDVISPDGTMREGIHYRISLADGTNTAHVSYMAVKGKLIPRKISVEGITDERKAAEKANQMAQSATAPLRKRHASLPTE